VPGSTNIPPLRAAIGADKGICSAIIFIPRGGRALATANLIPASLSFWIAALARSVIRFWLSRSVPSTSERTIEIFFDGIRWFGRSLCSVTSHFGLHGRRRHHDHEKPDLVERLLDLFPPADTALHFSALLPQSDFGLVHLLWEKFTYSSKLSVAGRWRPHRGAGPPES
jgi:hypothetical protein